MACITPIAHLLFVFFILSQCIVTGKYFPDLKDLALGSPINSTSTCGDISSKYCGATSLGPGKTCSEEVCEYGCCPTCTNSAPTSYNLQNNPRQNVFSGQPRPGTNENSLSFDSNQKSKISVRRLSTIDHEKKGFTICAWVNQTKGNVGTIFSKSDVLTQSVIYGIVLSDFSVTFYYIPKGSNKTESIPVKPLASQYPRNLNEWHFITVTVFNTELSYFLDGQFVGTDVGLKNVINERAGSITIGQMYSGANQYDGLMQDIFFYDKALTNREMTQVFTGNYPNLYIASECRCPPSHPKISTKFPAKCVKNSDKTESDTVSRLSKTSHPIEFVSDHDSLTYWLSVITDKVTIDIDLLYGQLQVFHVIQEFYGPFPEAIIIERSTDRGLTYHPWQYFADDCVKSFEMTNNGALKEPDSVNCLQYDKPYKYNSPSIQFRADNPGKDGVLLRPYGSDGCNKLYCSPKLLNFIKATNVRIHFYNHTYSSVTPDLGKYFGIRRLTISGRCECFGHAKSVQYIAGNSSQNGLCLCDCHSSTNTEGNLCNRCKPLYNNKPFHRGDLYKSYPCIKCECHDHATSCYYNETLDDYPNDRAKGGGGVCVNCLHNTTGENCEICAKGFYRNDDTVLSDLNVCIPCGCSGPGVKIENSDCAKDNSSNLGLLAGQCECKDNVKGRSCDQCKPGYHDLKSSHVTGCLSCNCDTNGTINGDETCGSKTGQCKCKTHVTGLRCDQCKTMFYNLDKNNTNGCKPCLCNMTGSTSRECGEVGGQCFCKAKVEGRQCDRCETGYHSLNASGCKGCSCSSLGTPTLSLKRCNPFTGKCQCKSYVAGHNCDRCKEGYYNLDRSNARGCTPCSCDSKGTIGNTNRCDPKDGSCDCKSNVTRANCDRCPAGFFNLTSSNLNGCQPCECYRKGTKNGATKLQEDLECHSTTGQCSCLSNVQGLKCDMCTVGYVWDQKGQGCIACNCDVNGSRSKSCNDTGFCDCKHENGVGGQFCDHCLTGYHTFNKGSCTKCKCNLAGVKRNECDEHGCLYCKTNVEGKLCDKCKAGTKLLKIENPFGCSGVPSQQGPPIVLVVSSRILLITWNQPDNPNGLITSYTLYRNHSRVYTGLTRDFNDTGLQPYTLYSYHIITQTDGGTIQSLSDGNVYRTLEDAPSGLAGPRLLNVFSRMADAVWLEPVTPNGIITKYILQSTNPREPNLKEHCSGLILKCDLRNLRPYTTYNFTVQACTAAGCTTSNVTRQLTRSAPPDSQPAPVVVPLPGGTRLFVSWDEPAEPNGVISRYELFQRNFPFKKNDPGISLFSFSPSVNPNQMRKKNVSNLVPYSLYEFRVVTSTGFQGNTASNWTRQRTAEAEPTGEDTINPWSYAISGNEVNISWHLPSAPNGIINRVKIYIYVNETLPPTLAKEANNRRSSELVSGLTPYTVYEFSVVLCNTVGCTKNSSKTKIRTLASAPSGQGAPTGVPLNSTHLRLSWSSPSYPNGPVPVDYHVFRSYAAFHYPPINAVDGVHFPGFGYYRLNKKLIPDGIDTNIEFWFRTQYKDSLLVFLAQFDSQNDFLAVELRGGIPYLIFDCGKGTATIHVQNSPTFNDKQWHFLKISRKARLADISIDGIYKGNGESPPGATVIGGHTGVYIGGINRDFQARTKVVNSVSSIKDRNHFVGCLRNVRLLNKPVNFQDAEEIVNVDPLSSGCPLNFDRGIYLKGGGYFSLKKGVFKGAEHAGYRLAFDFKTHHTSGLLLFTYKETPSSQYLALVLSSGDIKIFYETSSSQGNVTVSPKQPLCDGRWHNLELTNFGEKTFVLRIDKIIEAYVDPIKILKVSSELFFGGVPFLSLASSKLAKINLKTESLFGGCFKNIMTSRDVDLLDDVATVKNVDLSGCPKNVSLDNDTCTNANSTLVYSGHNEMTVDRNLLPFTDYLYRVQSTQPGTEGSGKSSWFAVKSGEGDPEYLHAPSVQPLSGGKSVHVSWSPPGIYNGIIRYYVLRGYNLLLNTSFSPVEKTIDDVTIHNSTLKGLEPYTNYDVTVLAFTNGGSGESPGSKVITLESVPENVLSPEVNRSPYSLLIFWRSPLKPNGVITNYSLSVNGSEVYRGLKQTFNLTGLLVYTPHQLQLTACTKIGCNRSPSVTFHTAEIPPQGVSPPHVMIRDAHSAEVRWKEPGTINGVMRGYQLVWVKRDDKTADDAVFNATANEFKVTVMNLTAGTWYNFFIVAINGGGSTRSAPTSKRTVESSPEDIPAPFIRGLSPYSIDVVIREPRLPNGNITRYELYEVVGETENILVLNGTLRNYTKSGLTPYTAYYFRSKICTIKGCGWSEIGIGYTLETAPNGSVSLNVSVLNSTTASTTWTTLHTPNGNVSYNLVVYGVFLVHGTSSFEIENATRMVASVYHPNDQIVYTLLLPYTKFRFQINATNTAGFILSNVVDKRTGEGAPIGLSPPNVTILNSTAARISWSGPARENGVLQYYEIKRVQSLNISKTVNNGLLMYIVMTDLEPYTKYQFQISASTRGGIAWSLVTIATTYEDIPESIDPPSIPPSKVDSRSLVVTWEEPTSPNGVITHYILYRNNSHQRFLPSNVTNATVTNLEPFTVYTFSVGVCTVVGCRNSSESDPVSTLEDVPEGQSAPLLLHAPGPSVLIRWSPPTITNGIISKYEIQRRTELSTSVVATVPANLSTEYQDKSVRPCTMYNYRVIAYTKKGKGTPSSWSNITVQEGAPDFVPTPTAKPVDSSTIHVTWSHATSQCPITEYIIRVLNNRRNVTGFLPDGPHRYTVGNLLPYTDYKIVVAACTATACRDSSPSRAKTGVALPRDQPAPTATPLNAWSLRVKWDDPEVPAGRIVGFRLFRRTLDEPLSENFTPTYYVLIYHGSAHTFDDKGLGVFSAQQYKVMVINTEGNTTSNDSLPYRTGSGTPRAGARLSGRAINHTSIHLNWTLPSIELLLGFVVSYEVHYKDLLKNIEYTFASNLNGALSSVVVTHLKPSRDYNLKIVLNNGNGTFPSNDVRIRTLDGAPEGFDKPNVRTINSTTIEVTWSEPTTTNGIITTYSIYTNGTRIVNTTALDYNLTSLIPYTLYIIQVEVCTVYTCVRSESNTAKTWPAVPQYLDPPRLFPGRRNMLVVWARSVSNNERISNIKSGKTPLSTPPRRPNGEMLEYRLFRRRLELCPTRPPPVKLCTYIKCSLAEQFCGPNCYNPKTKICCNGVLYNREPLKTCCDDKYVKKTSNNDVCCGGHFYPKVSNHQCCYNIYKLVKPGQVCCRDPSGSVVIGDGNACCDGNPYTNTTRSCVCGILYNDNIPRQCCGGKVTSLAQVCCGGTKSDGRAYNQDKDKKCCGNGYVSKSSLCCISTLGQWKVYPGFTGQCCEANRVDDGLSCCNNQGYNASSQVCADKSMCGTGTICNKSSEPTAKCDRCDFDINSLLCGSVDGYYTPVSPTPPLYSCGSDSFQIGGDGKFLRYNDQNLEPFTKYEYYLFARNTEGNVSSSTARNTTLMDAPEGLRPPIITVLTAHSIEIRYSSPKKTNGIISEYRVTRIDQNSSITTLVYNGTDLSFTDNDLRPFTGYLYILEACTTICSNVTSKEVKYTRQAAPANVFPPGLVALSPHSVQVRWQRPGLPNGVILYYIIKRIHTTEHSLAEWNTTVANMTLVESNLRPYTNYSYVVTACTVIGCTSSPRGFVTTLEAPPNKVNPPNVIPHTVHSIEVNWHKPLMPNGVIIWYAIYRNDTLIYNKTTQCEPTCSHVDRGLSPHTWYTYAIQVSTTAGSTTSNGTRIRTPESTPEGIPLPSLTPRSSSSVLVTWLAPSSPNGVIVKYSVVVNTFDERPAGNQTNYLVKGLKPFTSYSFQVKACTVQGCGVGNRSYAMTLEAPPEGQPAPSLVALSDAVVKVTWGKPSVPNGKIVSYEVERQLPPSVPVVVFKTTLANGLKWQTLNSGLLPYRNYSYRIRAINSAGDTRSPWTIVHTLEGAPSGIYPPVVHDLNATSVSASWRRPSVSNGHIIGYELWTRESNDPGNKFRVASSSRPEQNVTVSGLKPNTDYEFQLAAKTRGGTGYSQWALTTTREAAPLGLGLFTVTKNKNGRELDLKWEAPAQPNGVITDYLVYSDGEKVYQGTKRQCGLSRLQPYTNYTFHLEACTSAGCTKGDAQTIITAEIPPQLLAAPYLISNDSSVLVQWKAPLQPNGKIVKYQIFRTDHHTPVYNSTNGDTFKYSDDHIQAFTKYEYKIRAVNSAGSIDSPLATITTDQAPPTFVTTPVVSPGGSSSVDISWKVPEKPNGNIISYTLRRNGSVVGHWSKPSVLPLSYKDTSLNPATYYSYWLSVCTGGGCTVSSKAVVKTGESRPGAVKAPVLTVLSSMTIKVRWQPPVISNGIVLRYELYMNGLKLTENDGTELFYVVSQLDPFTAYTFNVSACTRTGCTSGEPNTATTYEAAPKDLAKPTYTILGPRALEIKWTQPKKPNGIIRYYLLSRNDTIIYNGTDLRFNDLDVLPFSYYKYIVFAFNTAGKVESVSLYTNRTSPGTPENVTKPTLVALSGTEIRVSWTPPAKPNGIIEKYLILYNKHFSVDVGVKMTYVVENLKYYTIYSFRVSACTRTSLCADSPETSIRTLEGPPLGLEPPTFKDIKARSVFVNWIPPLSPNGIIKQYVLERRYITDSTTVYNGSSLEFNDTNLLPYHKYHYRVTGYNSKSMVSSAWSDEVTTSISSPEDVPSPEISDITASSLKVTIHPPDKLNGIITDYKVELNGKNVSSGITTKRIIENLEPYTEYTIRVFACTIAGCTPSQAVQRRTDAAPPGKVKEISFGEVTSTTIEVQWRPPAELNGVLSRYHVVYKFLCSESCIRKRAVTENVIDVGLNTSYVITNLQPYTKYNIVIQVENEKQRTDSDPVEARTKAADPEYVRQPVANISGHVVIIDWSKSFKLNGPLVEYVLYENEVMIFRGLSKNSGSLPNRGESEFIYVVSATTNVNGEEKTVKSIPFSVNILGISPQTSDESKQWYREIWFLVLISVIIILAVFAVVALCLRKTSGDRTVFVRDRDPLPVRPKSRSTPMSLASNYTPSEAQFNLVQLKRDTHSQASTINDEWEKTGNPDWEGYVPYNTEWLDEERTWSDEEPEEDKSTKYLVFPDTRL